MKVLVLMVPELRGVLCYLKMNIANVLVVDDDVAVGLMLHRMLSDEQHQVKISHSVAEALAAIEEQSFDAYVMDYNLTDGTGLDVAERIRSKGSEAPIILLSGYYPSFVALRAEKLQISDYLEKPFSRARICSALKKAIGSPLANSPVLHHVRIRKIPDQAILLADWGSRNLKARRRLALDDQPMNFASEELVAV
jgi:DNA-binding NtrC family response regulator